MFLLYQAPKDKVISLLECSPIHEMVEDYWQPYKFVFAAMFVLHIIGNSCYSYYR